MTPRLRSRIQRKNGAPAIAVMMPIGKQNDILESGDALRLKAAYFHNNVDDHIEGVTLSPFDTTSGCPFGPGIPICFQYQNFAKAKIHGVELESVYDAGRGYAGLSASFTNGYTIS